MTASGKLFLDEFSGRVRRSPMVTNYWRRRQKQERLKRKLERRKQATQGGDDNADQNVTAGGDNQFDDAQNEQDQDMNNQYGATENVDEVVQEYD